VTQVDTSIIPHNPQNPLQFDFHGHPVRIVMLDNKPYFVASDVCEALDLNNVSMALTKLKPDEKGISKVDTLSGGVQDMSIVTESGLYRLVFRSNKPEAEEFRLWVFNEVLPQIMRTGSYISPNANHLDIAEQMIAHMRQQQQQIVALQWQQDNLQANQQQTDARITKLEQRPLKGYSTVADYMFEHKRLESPERIELLEQLALKLSSELNISVHQLEGDRLAFHRDILKRLG
jgi:prophage antirepressor-like protein